MNSTINQYGGAWLVVAKNAPIRGQQNTMKKTGKKSHRKVRRDTKRKKRRWDFECNRRS